MKKLFTCCVAVGSVVARLVSSFDKFSLIFLTMPICGCP